MNEIGVWNLYPDLNTVDLNMQGSPGMLLSGTVFWVHIHGIIFGVIQSLNTHLLSKVS